MRYERRKMSRLFQEGENREKITKIRAHKKKAKEESLLAASACRCSARSSA